MDLELGEAKREGEADVPIKDALCHGLGCSELWPRCSGIVGEGTSHHLLSLEKEFSS